jgi:hypothetical protein
VRRATLVALAILGCASACGAFGEGASDAPPGPVPTVDGGDAGLDDASGDAAPVTCTDEEKKTPKHCGRCGRDCGGGECVAGECQAYVLESNLVGAWYVAVDADYVYWTTRIDTSYGVAGNGDLHRRKKTGADTPVSLAVDKGIFDVAVAGPVVFFTSFGGDADGVFRTSVMPNGSDPERVGNLSIELSAQADKVYAAARADTAITLEVATTTGTSTPIVAIADVGDATEGLASDGDYVYWANHTETGSIGRLRLSDNAVSTVVAQTRQPRRLSVDDTFVYWTSDIEHAIRRARKDGSDVAPLPALLAELVDVGYGRVVADATHLYATIDREARVVRMDKDGKNVRELATIPIVHPVGLAQDETAIYFVECSNAGRLWRMVK